MRSKLARIFVYLQRSDDAVSPKVHKEETMPQMREITRGYYAFIPEKTLSYNCRVL